jgi:hypothetical protein
MSSPSMPYNLPHLCHRALPSCGAAPGSLGRRAPVLCGARPRGLRVRQGQPHVRACERSTGRSLHAQSRHRHPVGGTHRPRAVQRVAIQLFPGVWADSSWDRGSFRRRSAQASDSSSGNQRLGSGSRCDRAQNRAWSASRQEHRSLSAAARRAHCWPCQSRRDTGDRDPDAGLGWCQRLDSDSSNRDR